MKKTKYPIHKMGKVCGYQEYENGDIYPAPQYRNAFENIRIQKDTLEQLIKTFIEKAHELKIPIERELQNLWDRITDDYGLDLNKYKYRYDTNKQVISRFALADEDHEKE